MGYWVNTTYINHGNVNDVAEAIRALFTSEGMVAISAPAQRARLLVEPMQYDDALQNDLWALAIFPGVSSWSVIQTAPLELLSECPADSERMRLADLCVRLSTSAFQLNVYDSTGTILAEVSQEGTALVSGINPEASDPLEWHGERLSEEFLQAQFRLHPFQDLVAECALGDDFAEVIANHFGGTNAGFCSNDVSVDTLINHKPFTAAGGVALYFKWPGASRQRYSPCASWDAYRAAIRQR